MHSPGPPTFRGPECWGKNVLFMESHNEFGILLCECFAQVMKKPHQLTVHKRLHFMVSFLKISRAVCFYLWQLQTVIENYMRQFGIGEMDGLLMLPASSVPYWGFSLLFSRETVSEMLFSSALQACHLPDVSLPIAPPPTSQKRDSIRGNSQSFLLTVVLQK